MPSFDLSPFPVLDTPPITLADSGDSVAVDVRFTDGLLWMPEGQTVSLTASFRSLAGGNRRLELVGTFSPPIELVGGQLRLDEIELSIPFSAGSTPSLAITETRPVTAVGGARWILPSLASLLGLGEISFAVGVDSSAESVAFTLTLASAVTVPNAFIQVDSAAIGVKVLPAARAFELSFHGAGGLTNEGRAKARGALAPVFGSGDPLADVPSKVSFRRRFHLADGSMPDVALPAGPAIMSIVPSWDGGSAPVLQLPTPAGLGIDIGLPELSLGFDEVSSAPSDFGVRLTDCGLHFPALGTLPALDLAGALEVVQQAGTTKLRLQPSIPGGVELPGFLAFFLSRLRWLADAADLDELADQLGLSLTELEWQQLFRGLLTPTGNVPPGFATALAGLLDEAIAVLGASTSVERVFLVAFSAFEDVADDAYEPLWDALFDLDMSAIPGGDVGALVANVLQLLSDSSGALHASLEALFASAGLAISTLLSAVLDLGLEVLDDAASFLGLLMATLAAAIGLLDPGQLGAAIMDLAVAGDDASTVISIPGLLNAPLPFQMPDIRLPAIPGLLWSALGGLVASIPDFVPRLPTSDSLYEVVRTIAGGVGDGLAMLGIDRYFDPEQMFELLGAIIDYSASDPDRERMLLRTSRMPVLAAAVIVVAVIRAAVTNPLPWWDLMGTNIEHDPGFNTKRLDAPGTPHSHAGRDFTRKYLIVSDVHRDKSADDLGFLNAGSIDHFAHNQHLYERVLDWVDDRGYTLVEGGDCEELWYIRDFDDYDGPADELEQIIATNGDVYARLKALQHEGRHVRIKGNHDSYVDVPSVRSRLDAVMAQPGSNHPFDVYDFAVIPGVKTLQDAWLGTADPMAVLTGDQTVEEFVDEALDSLLARSIGLDSTGNVDTKPMVIAHGHQWDFWNCRDNELVGKMLSNLVGVPVDQLLDPFVDARGISWAGEPVINFASVASDLPVFDNFLATRPATKFAHEIQHQSSGDRLLIDDVMFMETVAALSAALGIEVDQIDDAGNTLPAASYPDAFARFKGMRFNQLCLGHTHFPQSQPFWDLETLLEPLGIGDLVRQVTSTLLFGWEPSLNFVRALYYNTGTAGWHEGVIWGIEITELGQAQLVFWTHNSIEPETMDWELDEMPAAQRAELDSRLDAVREQILGLLRGLGADAALGAAGAVAAIPVELATGIIGQQSGNVDLDLGALLDSTTETAEAVLGGLQSLIGQLIISAALRESAGGPPRTFTLRVPIPAGVDDALVGVTNLLGQMSSVDPGAIPKLACGWLQIVRNLPFFGGFESRRNVAGIDDRVFWVVASLLFQLPSAQVQSASLPLQAQADFDGDELVVTMTVG